jgi:hypothetical protein
MTRGFFCQSVCVVITCSTSVEPMPKASAPKAPCVAVRIAADECDAGQRQSLLRSDDMHDPPPRVARAEVHDPLHRGVPAERLDHPEDLGIGCDRARGEDVVVRRRDREVRAPDAPPGLGEPLERAGRALVEEVAVDVEQDVAARPFGHHMAGPDLLEHRPWRGQRSAPPA